MRKETKRYNITQSALYKCRSPKKIKTLLRLEDTEYKKITEIVGYHEFQIDKKDGIEKRDITAPNRRIKQIQSRVLELIQKVERPQWLISGEKGKCYIDNGKAHISSNYFLTIDIKKFYDNCKREYVYQFFKNKLQMSGDIAGICTDIVTFNQGIPTGCPTSQLIAYYAYEQMFDEIYRLAVEHGCIFTLYVDDMTFSSIKAFDVNRLVKEIDFKLRKYGHKPKYKKVKYYSHGKPVPITGAIINAKHDIKVPNSLQQKVFEGFQEVKKLQGQELSGNDQKKLDRLKGQIQASRNIETNKFPEIKRLVNQI